MQKKKWLKLGRNYYALITGVIILTLLMLTGLGCSSEVATPAVDDATEKTELDPPDYYIDYENGTIPLSDLPIGSRVADTSWEWEFRPGFDYSDLTAGGELVGPGEIKPVTWIVVAKDHYETAALEVWRRGMESHVTLLTEELIGLYAFDDSTDRGHIYEELGHNNWGESGTTNATRGLRPWLNSDGLHNGEGFYGAFSEYFKAVLLTTPVPNREWEEGAEYISEDLVFIPSATELGDAEREFAYTIGELFPFFDGADDASRVAFLDGKSWAYWTRSPSSGTGNAVRIVFDDGSIYYEGRLHLHANSSEGGVRAVVNLKADVMVSETKK